MEFEDFAKIEMLNLMLWDSDIYASSDTQLASKAYKAGQQSIQNKLDCCREENLVYLEKITKALELLNDQHDQTTVRFIRNAMNNILKGNKDD